MHFRNFRMFEIFYEIQRKYWDKCDCTNNVLETEEHLKMLDNFLSSCLRK